MPSARVEIFPDAGHWPHLAAPDRFAEVLLDFIAATRPVEYDRDGWRALLAEQRALAEH